MKYVIDADGWWYPVNHDPLVTAVQNGTISQQEVLALLDLALELGTRERARSLCVRTLTLQELLLTPQEMTR